MNNSEKQTTSIFIQSGRLLGLVIHWLAAILAYLPHDVLKGIAPFDMAKYKSLLRRYKDKKPDRIRASLESEFGSK